MPERAVCHLASQALAPSNHSRIGGGVCNKPISFVYSLGPAPARGLFDIRAMRSPAFLIYLASLLSLGLPLAPRIALASEDGMVQVALVIGNSNYKKSPLTNPVNDARDMAAKLLGLGFTVIKRENLTTKEIGPTLREFKSKLTPGAVALFFYAGHGLQVKGVNYLPVVDADIAGEEDVPSQSMSVSLVLETMEEAKTRLNLMFLDACRNNPFARRFRSAAGGLAKVNVPSGTLLSFATRPGSVASDGNGRNGLYTLHLLNQMDKPGVAIEQALKRVIGGVKSDSAGEQEPWMEGAIEGDFCFGGCSATPIPVGTSAADPAAIELTFWDNVRNSRSASDYQAYLIQYPKGRFAALAKARLKDLSKPESTPPTTPAPVAVNTYQPPSRPPATAALLPTPIAAGPRPSGGVCPGCTCSDLQARLSMGVEPLTDVQMSHYRQNCR